MAYTPDDLAGGITDAALVLVKRAVTEGLVVPSEYTALVPDDSVIEDGTEIYIEDDGEVVVL